MNVIQRLVARLRPSQPAPPPEQKSGLRTGDLLQTFQVGHPLVTTVWDVRKAIREGYHSSPPTRRCCDIRSQGLAALEPVVEEEQPDGTWERVDRRHPLVQLLRQPNPFMSGPELLTSVGLHLDLAGNALISKLSVPSSRGRPVELWLLDPSDIVPVPSRIGMVHHFESRASGTVVEIPAETVVHLQHPNPASPYWGTSPLLSCAKAVDLLNAIAAWNTTLVQHHMIPQGVLSFEHALSQLEWEQARRELELNYAGPGNARRPLVFGSGADWKMTSWKPSETDWLDGIGMGREDIGMCFGIPMTELGILAEASHSNVQELSRTVWTSAILPVANRVASGLTRSLCPHFGPPGTLRITFDTSSVAVLREDYGEKVKQLDMLVKSGTPYNAAIALLRLPLQPVTGGDVALIPANLMALTHATDLMGEPALSRPAVGKALPPAEVGYLTPPAQPQLSGTIQLQLPPPASPLRTRRKVELIKDERGAVTGMLVEQIEDAA